MGVENKYDVYIDGQRFDGKIPRIIAVDLATGQDKTSYWYKGMKWDLYYRKDIDNEGVE